MKNKKISAWLRQWDERGFDFDAPDAQTTPESGAPAQLQTDYKWDNRYIRRLERRELSVYRKLYPVLAAVLCAVMIAFLLLTVAQLPAFGSAQAPANNEVSARYLENGMDETGAVNAVAGVILDYRAFDTLGESHVLYTAVTAVLILLLGVAPEQESKAQRQLLQGDLIVRTTARIVSPIAALFGIYVMFNGHLGPGGGFSGGAILGAALILYALAFGFSRLERFFNLKVFRIVVMCALSLYSLLKCYSFYCGANGLESGIPLGTAGNIFSAGLILPLNLLVGIVVACTMYGFYSVFKRGRI